MATIEQERNERETLVQLLSQITENKPEDLVRPELGVDLNFQNGLFYFERMLKLFYKLADSNLDQVPFTQLSQIKNIAQQIKNHLDRILAFKATISNPANERDSIINFFRDNYDSYFSVVLPVLTYLAYDGINKNSYNQEAQEKLAEMDVAIKEVISKGEEAAGQAQIKLQEAQSILSELKRVSAETGVAKHSTHFEDEAKTHSETALKWLLFTIALGIVTMFITFKFNIKVDTDTSKTIDIVHAVTSKLMILSVLYYVLVWSGKNYSAHRHNFVVNKHRQNALKTFETFVKAAEDIDTKNAVLLQATQSIFSAQPSGYIVKDAEQDSPNKIIEIMRSAGSVTKGS